MNALEPIRLPLPPELVPFSDKGCQSGVSAPEPSLAVLSFQGRRANEVFTCHEWELLCRHLHNENASTTFVFGFRDAQGKQYLKSRHRVFSKAISWAWSTITGKTMRKLAFVPYSSNEKKESRWGAADFDAHDGNTARARTYAFRAFQVLLNHPDLAIILESTGSGGWHVWAIAQDFRPIRDWVKLLKAVATEIGAPLQTGVCEIFPPDSIPSRYGKPLRAPGCWNPGTDTLSEIHWHNCEALLTRLAKSTHNSGSHFPERNKQVAFSSSPTQESGLYHLWARKWSAQFGLVKASTRNDLLGKLVGTMFHQIGHDMASKIAAAQYDQKTTTTKTTKEKHLAQFEKFWAGAEGNWLAGLSGSEKALYERLNSQNERDAFRIIRSFERLARKESRADFPIVRDELARRLGITPAGAGWVRDQLAKHRVIERTQVFKANKTAARYRWLLDFNMTEPIQLAECD